MGFRLWASAVGFGGGSAWLFEAAAHRLLECEGLQTAVAVAGEHGGRRVPQRDVPLSGGRRDQLVVVREAETLDRVGVPREPAAARATGNGGT